MRYDPSPRSQLAGRRLTSQRRTARKMLPKRRQRHPIRFFAAIGAVLLLIVGVLLARSFYDRDVIVGKVITKDRVCDTDSDGRVSCKYMVFTDGGTVQITDAVFGTFRFNSADVYGRIEEGKTYEFIVYGWRIPIASQFQNVEKVREVTP